MFFIDCPGQYKLKQPLALVHANDSTGILYKDKSVISEKVFRNKSATAVAEDGSPQSRSVVYNRHHKHKGPGQPLENYIPKKKIEQNVLDFLTPTLDSQNLQRERAHDADMRARAEERGDTSLAMKAFTQLFKTKETRLDVEVWEVDGQAYGPAHFPLFVGTDFRARRSLQAIQERARKKHQRHDANVEQRQKEQQKPDQDECSSDQARRSAFAERDQARSSRSRGGGPWQSQARSSWWTR